MQLSLANVVLSGTNQQCTDMRLEMQNKAIHLSICIKLRGQDINLLVELELVHFSCPLGQAYTINHSISPGACQS